MLQSVDICLTTVDVDG